MLISPLYYVISGCQNEKDSCAVRGAPSAAARHLPRRGRGGFVGSKPDICTIHRSHPVEKDSSIAKIVQSYTIGGLRASKQTLAEQVSKACDSPPTHFCRSSEAC